MDTRTIVPVFHPGIRSQLPGGQIWIKKILHSKELKFLLSDRFWSLSILKFLIFASGLSKKAIGHKSITDTNYTELS